MRRLVSTLIAVFLWLGGGAHAQVNAGLTFAKRPPFTLTPIARFDKAWRLAFLPDGRMLITEKTGALWLVTAQGGKTAVAGVPPVFALGQAGLLGAYLSPRYAADHSVYLTYAEPGPGGSGLALARAVLVADADGARLENLKVIWRQLPRGAGGQLGGAVAFSPDGRFLFLAVGERQRFTPAQDPNQTLGKILRLTLDGAPAPGNPGAGRLGAPSVAFTAPPKDTHAALSAPTRMVALPGPNLAPAEIWASGVRTPYGLAFAPDGRLWEVEHGPLGGDELNLVQPGRNFGWPLVSYGLNYDLKPIPSPNSRPDLTKPVLYWTPVIAPGNLAFYSGGLFPAWRGSAFIGGLASKSLTRVVFDAKGGAKVADRWNLGHRIRDVEPGPDGALWLLEDAHDGHLFRATPK